MSKKLDPLCLVLVIPGKDLSVISQLNLVFEGLTAYEQLCRKRLPC